MLHFLPTGVTVIQQVASRGRLVNISHRGGAAAVAADGAGGGLGGSLGGGEVGHDDGRSGGGGGGQGRTDVVLVVLGGKWDPTVHDMIVALLVLR